MVSTMTNSKDVYDDEDDNELSENRLAPWIFINVLHERLTV
jgi:hypothetical protein